MATSPSVTRRAKTIAFPLLALGCIVGLGSVCVVTIALLTLALDRARSLDPSDAARQSVATFAASRDAPAAELAESFYEMQRLAAADWPDRPHEDKDIAGFADIKADIEGASSELLAVGREQAALLSTSPPQLPGDFTVPEYTGAWYLAGSRRGGYDGGGQVIQKGDRYFIVQNADDPGPGVVYLEGYVEDTGEVVVLNIGRSGRSADVLRLVDQEAYAEDQAAYRSNKEQARREHAEALVAYQGLSERWERAVAECPSRQLAVGSRWRQAAARFEAGLRTSARRIELTGGGTGLAVPDGKSTLWLNGFSDVHVGAVDPTGRSWTKGTDGAYRQPEHLDPESLGGILTVPITFYLASDDAVAPLGSVVAVQWTGEGDACDQLLNRFSSRYAGATLEDAQVRAFVNDGKIAGAFIDVAGGAAVAPGVQVVDAVLHRWVAISGPVSMVVSGNDSDRQLIGSDEFMHYTYPPSSPRLCLFRAEVPGLANCPVKQR